MTLKDFAAIHRLTEEEAQAVDVAAKRIAIATVMSYIEALDAMHNIMWSFDRDPIDLGCLAEVIVLPVEKVAHKYVTEMVERGHSHSKKASAMLNLADDDSGPRGDAGR